MKEFYDDKEIMTRDERDLYYAKRLSSMAALGYERSKKIKQIFESLGIKPSDIKTVDDLERLPVINREQLVDMQAEDPPFGGLDDPDAEIDRIFTSPGPVYEPHLCADDPLWARAYYAANFRNDDRVLNAFSYHMVAAGLTFHGGLRRVGAAVVPSGASGTRQQVQLIRDLDITGYTGTPSFLKAIIDKATEMGYDFKKDFNVKRACFAAEPLPPSLRKVFEKEYGIDTYQMYGATEVGDIAYECFNKGPWHICEEVIVEIVDPATGKMVPPGELGEVVVTRLNDIFFLFRFGTGDLSSITEEICPCGRTSLRLNGIAGRVGDAVKIRGMFVAPSQLKRLSDRFSEVKFQLEVSRSEYKDNLAVIIEPADSAIDRVALQKRFEDAFKEVCTVRIDTICFVGPGTISGNNASIIDKRGWK